MNNQAASLSLLAILSTASLPGCSSGSDNATGSATDNATNGAAADESLNDPDNLPPMSEDGGTVGVFNPDATTDVFACEARYYTELRGLYIGEVSYTSPDGASDICRWDATLQVRGANAGGGGGDTRVCDVSATYSYTLIEGSESCVDGSLTGDMDDPLAASSNRLDWESPDFPYDLPMILEASIADEAIVPAGTIAADARDVTWTFDGFDEAFLVDRNAADGIVEGTLVKF